MAEASDGACLQVDEKGLPLHFQKYEKNQHQFWNYGNYWVLWNADNGESEHPPGFSFDFHGGLADKHVNLEDMNSQFEVKTEDQSSIGRIYGLERFKLSEHAYSVWEPVLIKGRTLLTTRHQPFAINSIQQELCRYRIISERYEVYVDEWHNKDKLGYLGRVFIHKLPEFSPSIDYYTDQEYPQRQRALDCEITCVNALPVLGRSGRSCIGVLEVAWSRETASIGYDHPCYYDLGLPKEGDLKIQDLQGHSFGNVPWLELGVAYSEEIPNALKNVCEAHKLRLALMWAVCGHCTANASYTGRPISTLGPLSYPKGDLEIKSFTSDRDNFGSTFTYDRDNFGSRCWSLHLREGQGAVGQKLSSHGLIFCSDITQFSMVEYPLAHFAKFHGLDSCFAICLRSGLTRDVYVAEFFLPSSPIVSESVINLLRNILGTMKLHFQTSNLASGKDWGEKLPIQFVDYRNGEKYCYTKEVESQITTSPQSPRGTLQDEGEIVQQDPSSQQSIDKVANAEQSNVNCTSSLGNGTSKNLKRPQSKTGIQLGLNDILPHAKENIAEAAKALNVSRSTLKRICRDHNINRWPPRNIKENCSLPQANDGGQQILHSSYGKPSSFNQVLPTIAPTNSHDTMMPDVNFVNFVDVKAKHLDDIIKFKLLLSSGLKELQDEIAKRLKLTSGTYDIKYEDEENDLVLITCDEDVQYWIRTCGSQGNNSLKVLLLPK